jgi:hypothetical protein
VSAREQLRQAIKAYLDEGRGHIAQPLREQLLALDQDIQAQIDPAPQGRTWDNESSPTGRRDGPPDWPDKQQMVIQIKAGGE